MPQADIAVANLIFHLFALLKICLRLELHLTAWLDKSGANEFHIS
jgi:hypothetical protein